MGTHKQEAIGNGRSKGKSRYHREIERYDNIRDALSREASAFLATVEDDFNPFTGLTLSRRDDGGYLAIAKRDRDLDKEVMFAYGEDVVSAIIELSKKLKHSDWKTDKPWRPPKNSEGSDK